MIKTPLYRTGKILLYLPLISLILAVALYPILFFVSDSKVGILNRKSDALLNNWVWLLFFYFHISFGGLALLIGWVQFNNTLRQNRKVIHRTIGKIYIASVWLSTLGISGIAFSAEGGILAFSGFATGAALWFYTTTQGYVTARKQLFDAHKKWMTYSYAICTGAVTLRIYMPLLISITQDFVCAYQIVAWISWLLNLLVAWCIVRWRKSKMP
jgi:uncharacterized membrane protein